MNEFKFACPVCGQHIKCDATKSGTELDCPTCFQKLIVPSPPQDDLSKLILTATLARSRRFMQNDTTAAPTAGGRAFAGKFPAAGIVLMVLVCAAVAAIFAFREDVFQKPPPPPVTTHLPGPSLPPVATNVNVAEWTLNLADVTIPTAPVTGRINGRVFDPPSVTFQSGTLNFRQPVKKPVDLGFMIIFPVMSARPFANRFINIATNRTTAPEVLLRWKDDQGKTASRRIKGGYALRLDFGPITTNYLPGKIYFCAPGESKDYLAGTFNAEILKSVTPPPSPPPRPAGSHRRRR